MPVAYPSSAKGSKYDQLVGLLGESAARKALDNLRIQNEVAAHHAILFRESITPIPCEYCGRKNDPENDLCFSCGAPLKSPEINYLPSYSNPLWW